MVGASCFIFGFVGWFAYFNGDGGTILVSALQTVLAFAADYIGNAQMLSERSVLLVCACDRGAATLFALWLVALSMAAVSPLMVLALLPLGPVLAWSRASTSRSQWIFRHSVWHAFAACEAVGVLAVVYHVDGARSPSDSMLGDARTLAWLSALPVAAGAAVASLGVVQTMRTLKGAP